MSILNKIHLFIIYLIVTIDTIVFSILSIIFGVFNPYSKLTSGAIRLWARIILWVSGVKLIIEGLENIDKSKPYIFASNHQGAFDIPALFIAIPQTARFIAKKELFKIPILAQGMKISGMLEIDRGNSEKAKKTLQKAITTIKDGCSVIIFPEGTRSKNGKVNIFKKGGFVLSINGKIPIAPVIINGTQFIITNEHGLRSGSIKLKFLEPIIVDSYSIEDRNKLTKETYEKIVAGFEPDFNRK